jgi:lactoylglutathione lyase
MTSWLGQYCLNVADLDASVGFYTALGLDCTSRTETPQAHEAIVENPAGGSRLQLARRKDSDGPLDVGTAFWKLYVNTHDIGATFSRALEAGSSVESEPERMDRWPVTVAFLRDHDGYLVELVERHPWPQTVPTRGPWLGQYCLNVTDIEATITFYELLGLTCTSRTEIPHAHEAILEAPGAGGKIQLAQQLDQEGPLRMGSMWKLYVNTDDCEGLFTAAVAAGHAPLVPPMRLDRWPVTIAFVGDPDGYQVELVQRHDT